MTDGGDPTTARANGDFSSQAAMGGSSSSGRRSSAKSGNSDPYAFTHDSNGSSQGGSSSGSAGGDAGPSGTPLDFMMQGDPRDKQRDEKNDRKLRSLAETRGNNWGITGPTLKQVAVARPVHIQCSGDRLTILSDNGQTVLKTIPFQRRTEDSIDDLVLAVRDVVKTWGLAGRNMYWRPQLTLEIGPSGEGRFYELQSLLQNSGLDVVRKAN